MSERRLDQAALAMVQDAVADESVRARFAAKVVRVPGSDCLWWTGAISGRGHGRFWLADTHVIIAHRYAFGLTHGADALEAARVLGHRCDNPLCQRVGPGHVVISSTLLNRREWAQRRHVLGTPLTDPRGPKHRARALRDLARQDPAAVAADLERLRRLHGEQLPIW